MKIVTDHVFPDEPCHGLFEGPRMMPGSDGSQTWRWIQAVYVIRGDAIAEWTHDYGAAEDFEDRIQPLLIPGFGDDSVAQLQEHAEKNRHDDYWARRRAEMLAGSTLIKDHVAQLEKDKLEVRNRTVIGPAITVQRHKYSQEAGRRLIKERTRRGY